MYLRQFPYFKKYRNADFLQLQNQKTPLMIFKRSNDLLSERNEWAQPFSFA